MKTRFKGPGSVYLCILLSGWLDPNKNSPKSLEKPAVPAVMFIFLMPLDVSTIRLPGDFPGGPHLQIFLTHVSMQNWL